MTQDEQFLSKVRKRFELASKTNQENSDQAREDLRFAIGKQWNPQVLQDRRDSGRPALTFNRFPSFISQVTNEGRKLRPGIHVSAVDNGARKPVAEVLEGLIRHIQYDSDADIAYDTAMDGAVVCGQGNIRVGTRYISDTSFLQEIYVERILDHLAVLYDPAAKEYDRSDMLWCFVPDVMSRDEFTTRWPKAKIQQAEFWKNGDDPAPEWTAPNGNEEMIRVAEYWEVALTERTLVMLADGTAAFEDELNQNPQMDEMVYVDQSGRGRTRKVQARKIVQHIVNGSEVLESNPWAGRYIPLIPVWGKEAKVEKELYTQGLIRHSKDSQQLYNFYGTTIAETLSLAPRVPWVGVAGQFQSKLRDWQQANTKNLAFLEYDPVSIAGNPAPPPQRQPFEPPILALSRGRAEASEDLKATTGIFDASLGARGNETSGRAILARQQEGDTSNFHFIDNQRRSIRHVGRVILDLIPHIYDTEREVRILGNDMSEKVVVVNQMLADDPMMLSEGNYTVAIETGPSYATARKQAFESLTTMAGSWPELLQVAGDLILQNSDIPGADQLAERLRRVMPPNLFDQGDDQDPRQKLAQANQQAEMLTKLVELLQAKLAAANQQLQGREQDNASRERIAAMNNEVKLLIAELQANVDAAKSAAASEQADLETEVESANG